MEMTNTKAELIFDEIKSYVQSTAFAKFEKDNPTVAGQIKNLKAEDLYFGECPTLTLVHIEGDLTAEGVQYTDSRGKRTDVISAHLDSGAVSRYTIADAYHSCSFLIPADENRGDEFICRVAAQRLNLGQFRRANEINDIAYSVAKEVSKEALARLNYKLESCRVNNYDVVCDFGPAPVEIYPVYADLKDKKGNVHNTVIAVYNEVDIGENTPLPAPEIYADIQELIKNQKIGSKTSKSAKRKKVLSLIFGCIAVLAVGGLIASCVLGAF